MNYEQRKPDEDAAERASRRTSGSTRGRVHASIDWGLYVTGGRSQDDVLDNGLRIPVAACLSVRSTRASVSR